MLMSPQDPDSIISRTPTPDQVQARSARRRPSKPPLLCRTCFKCRAKKIKCSAERPRCASCAASNQECNYREDARRYARTTKADVKELQKEILTLRQLVRESGNQIPPAPRHGVPLTVDTSHCSNGPVDDESLAIPQPCDLPPGPDRNSNVPQSPVSEDHRHQVHFSIASSNSYGPGYNTQKEGEILEHFMQGPSPSEVNIAGAITEDGQVQVHGVTSTLHQPPVVTARAEERSDFEDEKNFRGELATDQLISYALIQRQRESSILSGPRIETKLELDGVTPELAFHLLDLHWNRQHYAYLLTYRPAIMDSLTNGGPHANKLLLNAIYYSSCLYSDRSSLRSDPNDPQTLGSHFYRRFKELLMDEIDRASIPTAVALLLCGASLVSHGKQSAGWVLCGTAYRMIIDLGCHLSIETQRSQSLATFRSTAIEFEIRKRVYWGAFMTDKFQSLYLGRAPVLRRAEARVPNNLHDSYEELEAWMPYRDPEAEPLDPDVPTYQPRPAYAVSTFRSLLALAEIASQVIDAFYSIESIRMTREVLIQTKLDIQRHLNDWTRNAPEYLCFDPDIHPTPPPHQITPHTTYWTLIILLERPFLSTGHLSFVLDQASQALGEGKCATAALKIWGLVKAYKGAFTLRRAPYLLSYATYSAVIVILFLYQTPQNRARFSECIPFFWSALLDLQQGCNAGLKKPLKILKTLMGRLGEEMPYLVSIERESRSYGSGTVSFTPDGVRCDVQGDAGLGENREGMPTLEFLQNLELDTWNNQEWLDTVAGDQGVNDSIYGLFMSG